MDFDHNFFCEVKGAIEGILHTQGLISPEHFVVSDNPFSDGSDCDGKTEHAGMFLVFKKEVSMGMDMSKIVALCGYLNDRELGLYSCSGPETLAYAIKYRQKQ